MLNNVCVIPARGGSTGIPYKNVEEVGGLPLIARAYFHSLQIDPESTPLLSTDSQLVLDRLCSAIGSPVPTLTQISAGSIAEFPDFILHRRPDSLATSEASIADALRQIRLELSEHSRSFRIWTLLQPTSPFRSLQELHEIRNLLSSASSQSSWVSVRQVDDVHPARMYTWNAGTTLKALGIYSEFQTANRQVLPKVYLRDGGFYLIGDDLVRDARQFSLEPGAILREFPWTLNIDNAEDLLLAKTIAHVAGEAVPSRGTP